MIQRWRELSKYASRSSLFCPLRMESGGWGRLRYGWRIRWTGCMLRTVSTTRPSLFFQRSACMWFVASDVGRRGVFSIIYKKTEPKLRFPVMPRCGENDLPRFIPWERSRSWTPRRGDRPNLQEYLQKRFLAGFRHLDLLQLDHTHIHTNRKHTSSCYSSMSICFRDISKILSGAGLDNYAWS